MKSDSIIRSLQQALLAWVLLVSWAAAWADPDEKKVNLPTGVKLNYVDTGARDAPAIIFLHGATDSSHSWSAVTPFLSDSYRALALDQRGHGDSDKPAYGYSVAHYADDVIAFMDKLRIRQAVLVGHSMGSFIAHQVASAYPDRVSKLVLIGSAKTAVGNPVITGLWEDPIGLASFQDPIDPAFIEAWQTGPNPIDPVFFAKVLSETAKVPAHVWKGIFRMLLSDDHSYFLKDITAPVLVIWGDLDALFSGADQAALLAALPPGAQFSEFAGAGHNTHWEQPQAVAKAIRDFLAN
ncbi:MAG: alpha/beta hydrolase [Candidatus Competibacteraceae bacterium]|nr:alpha/beta hydrolase [Candidatus Competibacteraceae bacterium]